MLDKQEAWEKVADRLLGGEDYEIFICHILESLEISYQITNGTKLQMISDLGSVTQGDPGYFHRTVQSLNMFWYDDGTLMEDDYKPLHKPMRAMLCLFISQLTDAEIEEMNEPTF
jgi:hypothetical protein